MTYLLTQIVFSLLLAGVLGAAVGWLVNGYRAVSRQDKNSTEMTRLSMALSQAETDKKMIEDDFRELKHRSEESIALLREETRQVPELKKNLEKSQTLVRQLLQKHDAELRQLSAENSVLNNKVRELENREKAVTRLQMDLNTERLKMRSGQMGSDTANADKPKSEAADPVKPFGYTAPQPEAATDSAQQSAGSLPRQAEIPLETGTAAAGYTEGSTSAESSIDDILDKADDVLTRFRNDPSVELDSFQMELDQELDAIRHDLTTDTEALLDLPESGQQDDVPVLRKPAPATTKPATAPSSERPFHEVFGAAFRPPERQDDLQQIFGIGPVTENTLNSIGISSYDQLALFTREHIEYVAEVLQIFPGRIERDNWVGSAAKLVASRGQQTTVQSDTANESPAVKLENEFEDSLEDA